MKMLSRLVLVLVILTAATEARQMEAVDMWVLDDRGTGDRRALNGASWRLFTDGVMGGVSQGSLSVAAVDSRPCLRLSGDVSLDNNGGFVQMALDITEQDAGVADAYRGVLIDVYGNGETYNMHLRTAQTRLPWQSYRISFDAPPVWRTLHLPFTGFQPYRTSEALQVAELRRIGVVAIGRAFHADLCVGRVAFYR